MVGNLPTNCLSVFDHFVKMALKYKLLKGWLDCFYERTTLITSWFLIILRQRLIRKRTCERYVIQSNSFDIDSYNSSFLKCTRQEGLRSSNSSEHYPLNIFGFSLVPKILQKMKKTQLWFCSYLIKEINVENCHTHLVKFRVRHLAYAA